MDYEGYAKVVEAFTSAGIEAEVSPVPAGGEHESIVTVKTDFDTVPADIIRALRAGNLFYEDGERDAVFRRGPQLDVFLAQPGVVTFRDKNIPHIERDC